MSEQEQKSNNSAFDLPAINIDGILTRCQQVFLYDDINEESALKVCKELTAIDCALRIDEGVKGNYILLRINSNGGSLNDGMAIIDTMRTLRVPVVTLVVGSACSMGAIIALCGHKRLITEHSRIMLHPAAGGVWSDYVDIQREAMDEVDKLSVMMFDLIISKTKLGLKKNRRIFEKAQTTALFLSAQEAKKYGVVDGIVKWS